MTQKQGSRPGDTEAAPKSTARTNTKSTQGHPQLHIPQLDPDTDTLTAALAYAAAGWYVLPVKRGKHPGSVVGNGWQAKSSRDPQQITAWFAGTNHGIALHCGRSGAVVFDVDHPDKMPNVLAKHLNSAPYQSTRPDMLGRGHYVFATPPGRTLGNSAGRLGGAWGEVRGLNGVIITQPTPHPNGGEYRWTRTGVVTELPAELAELLGDATPGEDAATDEQVAAFLEQHQGDERPEIIHGWRAAWAKHMTDGEARHPSMVSVLTGAMKEARAGYFLAAAPEHMLRELFIEAKTRPPINGETQLTASQANSEFDGILAWAIAQANAADLNEVRARTNQKMPHGAADIDPPKAQPMTLKDAHNIFRRWFGNSYDTDALDITLSSAAVERLDGDPIWPMLVSGSGAAKTETVQPLTGIGATITSSITSAGALLSATSAKERTPGATGGLLRKIGERGILVIKDFTTILSMDRNARAEVLAALREIYDGYWERNVGTDGGRSLKWTGRLVVVAASTTAWDKAHAVISVMGNRFVLVRIDSEDEEGREESGLQSILNLGSETQMRRELASAVAGVIAGMNTEPPQLSDAERLVLVRVANLATKARTAVEVDYRGDVEDAHASEAPTRFAKQLAQIMRGALAIGVDRERALKLAIRCAGDSMPPLRLAILKDIGANPFGGSTAVDVAKRIDKPRTSVDRQLQALHALGLATVKPGSSPWDYSLAARVDPKVLDPNLLPEMLVKAHKDTEKRNRNANADAHPPTHISGSAPHCDMCPNELWAEVSIARGRCERCHLTAGKPPVEDHNQAAS